MKNQNHINFKQNKPAFTLGGKDGLQLKKAAFTLAEVLIVLGIIGVVAAFTIPVLIHKIENIEYKSSAKKAYSALQNAYNLVIEDNGGEFKLADFEKEITPNSYIIFEGIKSHLNVLKSCPYNTG